MNKLTNSLLNSTFATQSAVVLVAMGLLISASPGAAGTVGFWRFENGTPPNPAVGTGTILDSSGNGLNGTPAGGPLYSSDLPPYASGIGSTRSMLLNGTSQLVAVPDSPTLQLTHSLTLEAWIKSETMSAGAGAAGNILMRDDERPGLDPYRLSVYQPGNLLLFRVSSTTAHVDLTAPIPFDQWIHVAGTLDDATGAMKLFVNGVVVNSTTTTVRPLGPLDPNYSPGLGIGGGYTFQYGELFHGWLDEVRISDAALDPSQFLIPEPSAAALTLLGAGLLASSRRRSRG